MMRFIVTNSDGSMECRKCGSKDYFLIEREPFSFGNEILYLCWKHLEEFKTFFKHSTFDETALVERCETCGQTVPEPEKAKRNTVSSCQRCGTGYEVLVTGSIVYCGKCEEETEYDF